MRDEQDEHTALRLVWLSFAGWWLSALWVVIAWVAILLGITQPAGFWMIAHLPLIVNLKPPSEECHAIVADTLTQMTKSQRQQRPFFPRLLYCIAVGWWLSLGWALIAWARSLSSHKQREPLLMFMRLPAIMTLRRY